MNHCYVKLILIGCIRCKMNLYWMIIFIISNITSRENSRLSCFTSGSAFISNMISYVRIFPQVRNYEKL